MIKQMFKFGRKFPGVLEEAASRSYDNSVASDLSRHRDTVKASVTVYKALRQYALITEKNSNKAGFGANKKASLAEIDHGDMIDCAAVTRRGFVYAGTYDKETQVMSSFVIGETKRAGTVIFLAIMEKILNEPEANTIYREILPGLLLDPERIADEESFMLASEITVERFCGLLAKLTDNIYMRCVTGGTGQDIKLSINESGECGKLRNSKIESGEYAPEKFFGTFQVLAKTPESVKASGISTLKPSEISGKYKLSDRVLTDAERQLIPNLPDTITVPKEVEMICEMVCGTYDSQERISNIILSGEAGSGKTTAAKLVAQALGRPYRVYTCHPDTDAYSLYGEIVPDTDEDDTVCTSKSFSEIMEEKGYPDLLDIEFDLEGSYEKLTGESTLPAGYSQRECTELLIQQVMDDMTSREQKKFKFVYSPIVEAIRNGDVLELQEIKAITRPGVLMALNSLLEQSGTIRLQNGEDISRHKDTVIIATTNDNYRGCEELNESVIDRFQLVLTMDLPEKREMVDRVIKRTGMKDSGLISEMADIVHDINEYITKNDIIGVCGMRSLLSWAMAVKVMGIDKIYQSCIQCVINKAATDREDRMTIKEAILDTSRFAR